ncbi:glycosyltransferase family 48 protein [Hypholoma sublateritium FD-334 SS-4]|uniref:Glycosyltransferase family 48 protein n=1 Tax=Hypholoma sublateritium (strain FD-334 SS-4) TaxID=945553 RepID=A0A0D2NCH6_HYPSF|nr:glycosyltransferase family 48 protein [Hypholoma sublateritium FD-334 SS-4]
MVKPVPEGLYLQTVIKPLYNFMRDQGYEVVDGKFGGQRLVDIPPAQRIMKLSQVERNRVFFKRYFEKRSIAELLVNFNRIWILHIAVYYFYTSFNSPKVYAPKLKSSPSPQMTWSAVALGGVVSTAIMIAATIAEFSYIPTTWNNASHLTTRLIFLFVILRRVSPSFLARYLILLSPPMVGMLNHFQNSLKDEQEGSSSSGETFPFPLPDFRGLLHSDIF